MPNHYPSAVHPSESSILLAQVRQIDVGALIAQMTPSLHPYLQVVPPTWLFNDILYTQIKAMPVLYQHGRVVWAALIQANQVMFVEGKDNSPGEVVYDPLGQTSIEQLQASASRLYQLKHTQPTQPDQLAYANHITNEATRIKYGRYPKSLSPQPLRISSIFFERLHFPDGVINLKYFPILVSDQCPGDVMILPGLFWPADFKTRWLAHSAQPQPYMEDRVLALMQIGHWTLNPAVRQPPLAKLFAYPTQHAQIAQQPADSAEEAWFAFVQAQELFKLEDPSPEQQAKLVELMQFAADLYHLPAVRTLAILYREGLYVEKNVAMWMTYLEILGIHGDAEACMQLASMYIHGTNCVADEDAGFKWLEQASMLGHPYAQHILEDIDAVQAQRSRSSVIMDKVVLILVVLAVLGIVVNMLS